MAFHVSGSGGPEIQYPRGEAAARAGSTRSTRRQASRFLCGQARRWWDSFSADGRARSIGKRRAVSRPLQSVILKKSHRRVVKLIE